MTREGLNNKTGKRRREKQEIIDQTHRGKQKKETLPGWWWSLGGGGVVWQSFVSTYMDALKYTIIHRNTTRTQGQTDSNAAFKQYIQKSDEYDAFTQTH